MELKTRGSCPPRFLNQRAASRCAALALLAMDADLLSTSDGSDLASLVRFPAFTSTSLPFKNLTEQNLAKIGLWSEAGRCAAGEHPASAARGPETANPPVGADVIHYSIDAALVCEFPDLPNPQNDVGCDIFRAKIEEAYQKRRREMARVIRTWRTSRAIRFLVLTAVLATTTHVIVSWSAGAVQSGAVRQTTVIGGERLVSVEPLSEQNGELCVPEPVGADTQLIASLLPQQSGSAAAGTSSTSSRPSEALRSEVAKRKPAGTIRDPRNAFASLVVDPARDEVIFAEENNFSVLVYARLENTPPRAALSEPKRIIQGENTYLEFACGVYVDPPTGDVYVINNDTLNWMTVWDRNARGNVKPTRKLHTPMATFGIAADEENQELLLTVQDDHAVVTFKKNAKELEGPVRLLQGPKTRMADPHGIAVDPKTGLIYVTNWGTVNERQPGGSPRFGHALWPIGRNNNIPGSGRFEPPSITVYRKDASGDVAPLRVIQGPKTGLDWPTSIAVHPDRREVFVANDTADTVTVYRTTDNGDVAPVRVLKGPKSMIKNPTGVALDLVNNELWVANFGSHSATVFPVDAAGDPTPKRVIRSGRAEEGAPMLGNPHTLAYDSKRDEILVSN